MKGSKRVSQLIFVLFLIVSLGLASFSFPGYSILENTTSHLGAQGSPNAWMMNAVFICLGAMAFWIVFHSDIRYHQVVGAVFGLSLMLTGVFRHAPLVDAIPVNQLHDLLHSVFASLTGFSFTLLAAGHGLMSRGKQRTAGIGMALIAVLLSAGMMAFPAITGLLQRIMFASAFGWLFFHMKPPGDKKADI